MTSSNTVDVEALLDRQKFGWRNAAFVFVALLALIADGFDLQIMGFVAPGIVRDWDVNRAALGPVFSASLVGILVGAPLFGWIGDRFGRKTAVIASSLLYGGFSLAGIWATSLTDLGALRFFTGMGLGGVLPNMLSLSAELAPKRFRPMITSLVVIGLTLGAGLPGVARAMVPVQNDWQWLFFIGGVVPIGITLLVALVLPESMLFLTHRGVRRKELERRARRIDPSLQIDEQTRFVLSEPSEPGSRGLRALFQGRYAVITLLLWLVFASTLLTIFTRTSWLPLLLDDAGISRNRVASVTLLTEVGGAVCGLVTGFVLGRLGLIWVVGLLVLAGAAMVGLARVDLAGPGLEIAAFACGVGITGGQGALNAAATLIYPTACRPTGVGSALGVGRLGTIMGPLIGSMVIALGATPRDMFLMPLIPLALAIAALLWLRRIADVKNAPAV